MYQKNVCDCEMKDACDKCCELEGGMATVNGSVRDDFTPH